MTYERLLLDLIRSLAWPLDPAKLPAWCWTPEQVGCKGCIWCDLGLRTSSRGFAPPKEWSDTKERKKNG